EKLQSQFGRQRRFYLITRDNKKDIVKEAYAFLPQGTASDVNLSAAIRLHDLGLDLRLLVHDSILVECKQEEAEATGELMRKVMSETATELLGDFVPFPVDVKI